MNWLPASRYALIRGASGEFLIADVALFSSMMMKMWSYLGMPSRFIAACCASLMVMAGLIAYGFLARADGETSRRSTIRAASPKRRLRTTDSARIAARAGPAVTFAGSAATSAVETPSRAATCPAATAYGASSASMVLITSVESGVTARLWEAAAASGAARNTSRSAPGTADEAAGEGISATMGWRPAPVSRNAPRSSAIAVASPGSHAPLSFTSMQTRAPRK